MAETTSAEIQNIQADMLKDPEGFNLEIYREARNNTKPETRESNIEFTHARTVYEAVKAIQDLVAAISTLEETQKVGTEPVYRLTDWVDRRVQDALLQVGTSAQLCQDSLEKRAPKALRLEAEVRVQTLEAKTKFDSKEFSDAQYSLQKAEAAGVEVGELVARLKKLKP